jgi:cyclohexyl-isocyanide hydratase
MLNFEMVLSNIILSSFEGNIMLTRRDMALAIAALTASASSLPGTAAAADATADALHQKMMRKGPAIKIALVMYPGFFAQDIVGPHAVFGSMMNTEIYLVAKTMQAVVATPRSLPIMPSHTFANCPADLDVIMVPGGALSTVAALNDKATVDFIRARGRAAKYVTSVCTGSMLLGAAGLLDGYKATSHWLTRDLLASFGATPVEARVVVDRNRITGGGVTAGIDFALQLAALMSGQTAAEAAQLVLEYDPQPPFNAGSPRTAPKEVTAMVQSMFKPMTDQMKQIALLGKQG